MWQSPTGSQRPAIRRGPIFRPQRTVQQSQLPRSVQPSPHVHSEYFIRDGGKDTTIVVVL